MTVQQIREEAAKNKWSFPKAFHALKDIAVKSYIVDLINKRDVFLKETEKEESPLTVQLYSKWGLRLDKGSLASAIKAHQMGNTDYPTVVNEMFAAGVTYYEVSMTHNTVTYFGNGGEHVEHVPDSL